MKTYIEDTLHQSVMIDSTFDKSVLPLSIRNNYSFYNVTIGEMCCVMIHPNENKNLSELRRVQNQAEQITKKPCALYLTDFTYYSVSKMIEEGIPFIIEGKQIYLPFLGISLNTSNKKMLTACTRISFLTQKLLLSSIYNKWEKLTVTQAANFLEVTKATVSKCFDEIETLNIPVIKRYGRNRFIVGASKPKGFWEKIRSYLINPVIKSFSLKTDLIGSIMASGMSALAHYSMISDNNYPTYAVAKEHLKDIQIQNYRISEKDETPACVLHELGYSIVFGDGKAVDPLTVALMITDNEKNDPRVSMAIDEMLEEYVW